MVQSLRRYYDDRRLKSQLVNAGKYFAGVCAGFLFVLYKTRGGGIQFVPGTNQFTGYYLAFIFMTFVSLVYSYLWDIIMDWGLFNSTSKETFALRPVITYSRPFYYYAIVINLILRCTFAITMFINVNNYAWLTSIGYGTLIGVLELYRRWVWSLLRIENEQVNNLERYRHVLDIPEINDYIEDRKVEENQYNAMIKNVLHTFNPKLF